MTPDAALAIVRRHYPRALSTNQYTTQLLELLASEYGLPDHHILLADSICSDDVNAIEYPAAATRMLGPFHLGGLDGFPHAGLTGMAALASHVPDEGAVLLYYAPHIGVSGDGTLGMILRPGQHQLSGCCGAARAALAKLGRGEVIQLAFDTLDQQQGTVEQILLAEHARVLRAAAPLKEATEVMYEAIAARMGLLVTRTAFNCRYVVSVGGILINGDADMGSFHETRHASIRDLREGTVRTIEIS